MRAKLKPSDVEDVAVLYKTGLSLRHIASKYQCDSGVIQRALKTADIPVRNNRKYNPDQVFLYNLTPESAYFYGFCLGDGCIRNSKTNGSYSLVIAIHPKDKIILDNFASWLKLPKEAIRLTGVALTNQQKASLTIQDKTLVTSEWVRSFGLQPNKTYNPIIPTFDNQFISWFLLGLFDADGSVRFDKKKSFQFVNNHTICNWVMNQCEIFGINRSDWKVRNVVKDKITVTYLVLEKIDLIVKLASALKLQTAPLYLERKWGKLKNHLDKPRQIKKDNSNSAKLTINQVIEIRKLINQGCTDASIARQYNVTPTSIYHIRVGKTWMNVR